MSSHHGRAVVVEVAEEAAAGVAEEASALAVDAPVVECLEEGPDAVLLNEAELGVVDPGEGDAPLVAGLEVGVRRVQVRRAQVEVHPALRTPTRTWVN